MNDLISRQAAIDAILHNQELYSNNFGNDPIDRYTIAIIDNDAQTIAQLPSARPDVHDKNVGEWNMFDLITSAYYGKMMYSKQDNGIVYSRYSCKCMSVDEAIREFLAVIGEDRE